MTALRAGKKIHYIISVWALTKADGSVKVFMKTDKNKILTKEILT